jgi:hypothetical protein
MGLGSQLGRAEQCRTRCYRHRSERYLQRTAGNLEHENGPTTSSRLGSSGRKGPRRR